MIFRFFLRPFSVLLVGAIFTGTSLAHDPAKAFAREFKRRHFFADLFMKSYTTGMQAANEAQEHNVPAAPHALKCVAHQVADISITELARKSLSRYTPFGLLNKYSFMVGPCTVQGKSITRSVLDSARTGIFNAAYFRKKYGSWWPLHFGKKYFLPFIVKSVVLGAIIPPIFELTRLNRIQKWGSQSWWKYELASVALGFAGSYIAQAYDYIMPKWIQPSH